MIKIYLTCLQEPGLYQTVTFDGPPKMDQVLWPRHCVQKSWGAEMHKDLKVAELNGNILLLLIVVCKVHPKKHIIYKGVNPNVDSYSAFFDNAKLGKTCLVELLQEEEVTDVYVCGIATDVCVGQAFFFYFMFINKISYFLSLNSFSCY